MHTHTCLHHGVVVVMVVRLVDKSSVFVQLRMALNAREISARARQLVMPVSAYLYKGARITLIGQASSVI